MFKPLVNAVDQFIHPGKKRCYDFSEGRLDDNELLGYKGASLCDLNKDKQIPVPAGFIITTESCKEYYQESNNNSDTNVPILLKSLISEYTLKVKEIENKTGRIFGGNTDVNSPHVMPLLFSIRSSPTVSMPGMIDTILNVGMNDEVCIQITKATNNPRFAFDIYKRFLQMFGNTVLGVENYIYDEIVQNIKTRRGSEQLTLSDLQRIVNEFKAIVYIPDDVYEQLHMTIEGIFRAWFTPKAYIYRNLNNIPISLGTAVVIQSMVYGNINHRSGSGVCFTRDPINGERIPVINFLSMSEGKNN
jgi:pyruvate,orthophosphate dikinase